MLSLTTSLTEPHARAQRKSILWIDKGHYSGLVALQKELTLMFYVLLLPDASSTGNNMTFLSKPHMVQCLLHNTCEVFWKAAEVFG